LFKFRLTTKKGKAMLFKDLPERNQFQIVDALLKEDPEQPVTEEDKGILRQYLEDERNFIPDSEV